MIGNQASLLRLQSKILPAASLVGGGVRFVVTGPIELRSLGVKVETAIATGNYPLMIEFLPKGAATPISLCAYTNLSAAAAERCFLLDGTKATALYKTTDLGIGAGNVLHMPMVLSDGTIRLNFVTCLSTPGLAIGSTPANVSNIAFTFNVVGTTVSKAAVPIGTALTAVTVPQNKYGLWAFTITAGGTITATAAAGNASGYDTEVAAIAALPTTAAASVLMGYITVMSTDGGGFIGATTSLAAGAVTAAYYSTYGPPATGAVKAFLSWYPLAMDSKVQIMPS